MTLTTEALSAPNQDVLAVMDYFPFLREEDPRTRLAGLRGLSPEGLMFMTVGVNCAIQGIEWASGAEDNISISTVTTDPITGERIEKVDYRMPPKEDRVELFEFAKQLIDTVIDTRGAIDPDGTLETCALLCANADILIHPSENANGRSGRAVYYLLKGELSEVNATIQVSNYNVSKFGPYDLMKVVESIRTLAERQGLRPQDIAEAEIELDFLFDRRDNRALDLALKHIQPGWLRYRLSDTLQQDMFAAWGLCKSFPDTKITKELFSELTNEQALAFIAQDGELKKEYVRYCLLKLVS
jgi:hypothetical protein